MAIGNTDAHAKNISLPHPPNGETKLAPAYDVSPHRHYPEAGYRAAMDVNGVGDIDAVTAADLVAEGESWGVRPVRARSVVSDTLEHLRDALADPAGLPVAGVPDPVLATMLLRTRTLLDSAR